MKADAATQHIPIIAFAGEQAAELQAAAQKAGATLVVGEATIANYLPELLNQALQCSNRRLLRAETCAKLALDFGITGIYDGLLN